MEPHGAPGTCPTQPSPCAEDLTPPAAQRSPAGPGIRTASSVFLESTEPPCHNVLHISILPVGWGLHVTEGILRPRQHHSLAQDHIASCQNGDGAAVSVASPVCTTPPGFPHVGPDISHSHRSHLALPHPPGGSAPGQCDSGMRQLLPQLRKPQTEIQAAPSTSASLAFQPNVFMLDTLPGRHRMLRTSQSALIVSVTSAASSDGPVEASAAAVTSRAPPSPPAFYHSGQHFLGALICGLSSRLG